MSKTSDSESPVFYFNSNDPDTITAAQNAQESFRYLWRELSWEQRRVIPALDMAAVKVAFCDNPGESGAPVEHMWLNEIDFDGYYVWGVLLNTPNQLESVVAGDSVRVPLNRVGDWMYAIFGEVYGAYSVDLIRKKMNDEERSAHDEAWGLNFGEPGVIKVVPDDYDPEQDHPMSVNMAESFQTFLSDDPSLVNSVDEKGWTLLHHQSLAGNKTIVDILLSAGADARAKTKDGRTALDLASTAPWPKIEATLRPLT